MGKARTLLSTWSVNLGFPIHETGISGAPWPRPWPGVDPEQMLRGQAAASLSLGCCGLTGSSPFSSIYTQGAGFRGTMAATGPDVSGVFSELMVGGGRAQAGCVWSQISSRGHSWEFLLSLLIRTFIINKIMTCKIGDLESREKKSPLSSETRGGEAFFLSRAFWIGTASSAGHTKLPA